MQNQDELSLMPPCLLRPSDSWCTNWSKSYSSCHEPIPVVALPWQTVSATGFSCGIRPRFPAWEMLLPVQTGTSGFQSAVAASSLGPLNTSMQCLCEITFHLIFLSNPLYLWQCRKCWKLNGLDFLGKVWGDSPGSWKGWSLLWHRRRIRGRQCLLRTPRGHQSLAAI